MDVSLVRRRVKARKESFSFPNQQIFQVSRYFVSGNVFMVLMAKMTGSFFCLHLSSLVLSTVKIKPIIKTRYSDILENQASGKLQICWSQKCKAIPWCSGIVWFHHLSPSLPNFYQTRQKAGTLYSVCTVALSKTSLFSYFANVSGKGINMLCAKWITAN